MDYDVEVGPPLRGAFPQPGGILDNWQGIVSDPSGSVPRASEFKSEFSNWNDPALQSVKKLFGGDLFHCKHLKRCFVAVGLRK